MSKFRSLAAVFVVGFSLAACSGAARKAMEQPDWIDLSFLNAGTHRTYILGQLGRTVDMKKLTTGQIDIYNFTQGYSSSSRTGRILLHSTMGIVTLGLADPIGMSVESYARGTPISLKLHFDEDDKLINCLILQGYEKIKDETKSFCGVMNQKGVITPPKPEDKKVKRAVSSPAFEN